MSDSRLVEPICDGRASALRAPRRARPRDGCALLGRLRLLPRQARGGRRRARRHPHRRRPRAAAGAPRQGRRARAAGALAGGARAPLRRAPLRPDRRGRRRCVDLRHDGHADLLRLHRAGRRDDGRALGAARFRQAGRAARRQRPARASGSACSSPACPIVRALERMGARPIPVGAEAGTERILRIAELVRPRVLACTPSYATSTSPSRCRRCSGGPTSELGIEIILCAGEPGAGLPEVRAGLQQAFGAKLYDLLGGAHGVMCCSCDVGAVRRHARPRRGLPRSRPSSSTRRRRAPIPLVEGRSASA